LHQDTGTVTGKRIGADGATVGQVLEYAQALLDDFVACAALDVGDEADATGKSICYIIFGRSFDCPATTGSQKAGQYSAAGPVVQFGGACFSFLISGICELQWRQIIALVPA
jgi:hypothetical protein